MEAKVYFSKEISAESILKMYKLLGKELPGKVAVKVHSGEVGNQNFLKPNLFKEIVNFVNGTIVECNTAYEGERNTSEKHMKTFEKHGWNEFFQVDLLDEKGPDMILPIPNGKIIKENYVGKNLKNYNSMLVLSHFKGHPMGGYGGALKQLSIGVSSAFGKLHIHSAGSDKKEEIWTADHDSFLKAMAEAAGSVANYFQGEMVFINIMKNMSVDCDCCSVAEDPCLQDLGILISLDPVAIDQACIDLVYKGNDPGKAHFIERVESRNGLLTIKEAEKIGYGTRKYQLINVLE